MFMSLSSRMMENHNCGGGDGGDEAVRGMKSIYRLSEKSEIEEEPARCENGGRIGKNGGEIVKG